MKQRSSKSLQITSLCCSIAISTHKVLLTFNKVEKTKHEKFNFIHLSLFLPSFLSFFFSFAHNCNNVLCDDQLVICMTLHDICGIYFAVHVLLSVVLSECVQLCCELCQFQTDQLSVLLTDPVLHYQLFPRVLVIGHPKLLQ